MKISIAGDDMRVKPNGKRVGQLKSPGIGYKTKTDFEFTVKGKHVEFDDVRVWKVAR